MTAQSEALAERLRPLLPKGLNERKMFGGIGFMLEGNMAIGTTAKGDLLVRIDPDKQDAALARPGAYQMHMGPRPMTGFIAVAAGDLHDPKTIKDWIAYAIKYAKTLPAK